MTHTPIVSICLPVYNTAPYLADCIRSIQAQTLKDWELVIVNDGSTDSSQDLLDWYAKQDKRITVITTENQGIAQARNTAVAATHGAYIAVMDSDDVMYKGRLKIGVGTLEQNKAEVFYSAYYRANEDGQLIDGVMPPRRFSKDQTKVEDILKNQLIPHVTVIAKRHCFEDNPYNNAHKVNDDLGLVLSWWKAGYKFCMSKHPLVMVRYHDNSTSATKDAEVKAVTQELRDQYAL